jgi:hypothetical protein
MSEFYNIDSKKVGNGALCVMKFTELILEFIIIYSFVVQCDSEVAYDCGKVT